jgi:hypothetical protein
MADQSWWDVPLVGNQSIVDIGLGAATGGLWSIGKEAAVASNGNPVETAAAVANPLGYLAADYATGSFGRDNQQAIAQGFEDLNKRYDEAGALQQQAGQQAQAGLNPYAQLGADSIDMQRALAGLNGPEAQQAALQQLQNSPQFTAQLQAGEDAILRNASATGGLRGGNTQAALGQFAPQLLNQLIEQQLNRLGGFSAAGQQAAGQQGAFGLNSAGARADLLAQQGQGAAQSTIGQQAALQQGQRGAFDLAAGALGGAAQIAAGMPPTAAAGILSSGGGQAGAPVAPGAAVQQSPNPRPF